MEKIFIVIIVLIALIIFWKGLKGEEKDNIPYRKKDFLLNIPERVFFEKIIQIIPKDYVVYPQIVLSSIVKVETPKNMFWKYQNKINKKTIDFVIFKKPYFVPVLAIEYDGKTHKRNDRMQRDNFVNKVLEKAQIGILHVKHSEEIDYNEVKKDIISFLKSRENN